MTMDVDLQPDELEALQAQTGPEPVAKVHVDGPVRTQELPRKAGATFSRLITNAPVRLLTADHRRAVARVVAIGGNMNVALVAAAAQLAPADTSRMALWPQNTVYTLTADTELWVSATTGTITVSVVTEFWATGE